MNLMCDIQMSVDLLIYNLENKQDKQLAFCR